MAGTKEGGRKASLTNKAKYGDDFYIRNGRKGGKASTTGGFASTVVGRDGLTGAERAKLAGAKGGKLSKRGPAKRLSDEDIKIIKAEIAEANELVDESIEQAIENKDVIEKALKDLAEAKND